MMYHMAVKAAAQEGWEGSDFLVYHPARREEMYSGTHKDLNHRTLVKKAISTQESVLGRVILLVVY